MFAVVPNVTVVAIKAGQNARVAVTKVSKIFADALSEQQVAVLPELFLLAMKAFEHGGMQYRPARGKQLGIP